MLFCHFPFREKSVSRFPCFIAVDVRCDVVLFFSQELFYFFRLAGFLLLSKFWELYFFITI
ncbi:unnamed protein product, partial [Cylicocyclus nassatus]